MKRRLSAWGSIAAVLLPLGIAWAVPAAAEPAAAPSVAGSPSPHRRGRPSVEDRFQELVKALKLDAAQQAEVRRALRSQREAIRRLASAPADPEVPRVAAIHAIMDHTSERIRAVLSDEQKKVYSQPLPHDFSTGDGKPSVEEWQKALRQKGRQ